MNDNASAKLDRRAWLKASAASLAAASVPSVAPAAQPAPHAYVPHPRSADYRFRVQATSLDPDGRKPVPGVTVDGRFPGPEIRARAGQMLRVVVENGLADSPSAIHWHGLLVPAGMDGVPDVANYPIDAGRVYVYEFPLRQTGTYWYHSHWQLQEQIGLAGPIVIESPDDPRVDHDVVIMIGDWLHASPYAALEKLKQGAPPGTKMEMDKPDLADLAYDAFLINGRGTQKPWALKARRGARIRLRIVNTGASTYFRVRLDGHPLTVTHADGLAVQPVTVDHLTTGMAETYDATVTLSRAGSFTLHAVALDNSGQAIAVLHTPDALPKANLDMPKFDGRELSYADLRSAAPTTLPDGPSRTIDLTLGGNMAKYVWTINGEVYPKTSPLLIRRGERVQVSMRNDTSMWHPMHLHGHFFRVDNGAGPRAPLKHTVNVPPKGNTRIEFTADNPGRWIFHCHNLYHFEAGMARVFEYEA
jgi:FtsP/CotA-like multicopper oxidase with cupredoxin domain